MSNYESYVRSLSSDLEKSNMQKHMGTMSDEKSPERAKILQNIINYEYNEFINYIYMTALGNFEKYYDGKILKNHLNVCEQDLIPIFTKMNEDCLDDPEFSKSISSGESYIKNMGTKKDEVLFYLPNKTSSIRHDVEMNLLYIPSISKDEPNKFRIDVKEHNDYPYLNFSVDIMDDGTIKYNDPAIVDKDSNGNITKTITDINNAHIRFNEDAIMHVRDVLVDIMKKTGIIEENSKQM